MSKEFTFGPGSLESLHLKLWRENDAEQVTARLTGGYRVYCGNGNEHTVEIEVDHSVPTTNFLGRQIWRVYHLGDDVGDPESIARELLEFALEDWSDPCEGDHE